MVVKLFSEIDMTSLEISDTFESIEHVREKLSSINCSTTVHICWSKIDQDRAKLKILPILKYYNTSLSNKNWEYITRPM